VLDHDHACCPRRPGGAARGCSFLDVGHVQADRRLVENVERVVRLAAAAGALDAGSGSVGPDLASSVTSLMRCASPPESVGFCLSDASDTEADVLQQAQAVMDLRMRGEEFDGFVDAHREHVADRLPRQCTASVSAVEAQAVAGFADHPDVGQEAHFDSSSIPLSVARLAAAAGGIEREAARGPSRASSASLVSANSLRIESQKPT
jgi:hypothetical protein